MSAVASEARTNAAVSERVVVLMTPDDKRQIEAKAKAADMSVGEFLRRAAEAYDPSGEETEQIEALLRHIKQMGGEILTGLDAATAQVKATRAYLAQQRARS